MDRKWHTKQMAAKTEVEHRLQKQRLIDAAIAVQEVCPSWTSTYLIKESRIDLETRVYFSQVLNDTCYAISTVARLPAEANTLRKKGYEFPGTPTGSKDGT